MKKIYIISSIILIVSLSLGIFFSNNTKIKLFENVDTCNVAEINIFNPGASFNIDDENEILEIMNYLKNVKLSKNSDKTLPNTTPEAQIALEDKDGKTVSSVAIYGYVAILYPNDGEWYTISGSIYSDLENLCKNLRNK